MHTRPRINGRWWVAAGLIAGGLWLGILYGVLWILSEVAD